MGYYEKLLDLIRGIKDENEELSSSAVTSILTAELTLLVSILICLIMLRHLNLILMVVAVFFFLVIIITSMPLMIKVKNEQSDSFDRMSFHAIIALALLVIVVYWGVRFA